jgi:hypothetical protein
VLEALLAFARARASSDLGVLLREVHALAPNQSLRIESAGALPTGLDHRLLRAMLLEVLCLLVTQPPGPRRIAARLEPLAVTLEVHSPEPMVVTEAMEWVVQLRLAGGRVEAGPSALRLTIPVAT